MSLLIIEGQGEFGQAIEKYADALNVFDEIYVAETIEKGMAIAQEQAITMFIVDLDGNEASGYEFVRQIRELDRYRLTWVILLSDGHETVQEVVEAFNSNRCNRYVRKPFNVTLLIEMVEDLSCKKMIDICDDRRLRIKRKSIDYFFDYDDILFVETVEKMAYIYTVKKKHKIGRITLSELQERLDAKKFIRVHRSYIINTDHIDYIKKQNNQNQIKIKHYEEFIPVGRTYKETLEFPLI